MPTTSRDEYVSQLKIQIDRWNAQLARWEAQGKGTVERLREQREALLARRKQALNKLRLLA